MPELPEVETIRLQLLCKIVGKTIASVTTCHPKTVAHDTTIEQRLTHKSITHIDRIGKLLIFSFANEHDLYLLAHLKMTGQFWFVASAGAITGGGHTPTSTDKQLLPNKHTRVIFTFTDDNVLYFNDMRLFGYIKLVNAKQVENARAGFGPELIDPIFDTDWFVRTLRQKKSMVKAALLDQSFVAGLGNIYVDETLWRAAIRPTRRCNKITRTEASAIAHAARDVMNESIAVGGTTFQHFVDTSGQNGNFTDYLKVFGKQDTPCSRCNTSIKKIRTAGRGTHYCPNCQK